jgi:hypothetical protein
VNWKRIFIWAILLFITPQIGGFISGLSMMSWEMYGQTIEQAVLNARLFRRIAIGIFLFFLYLLFLRGITTKWFENALALFAISELIGLLVDLVFFSSYVWELAYLVGPTRNLGVCLIAVLLVSLYRRKGSNSAIKATAE